MVDESSATTEKSGASDLSRVIEAYTPNLPSGFLPNVNKRKMSKVVKERLLDEQRKKSILDQREKHK